MAVEASITISGTVAGGPSTKTIRKTVSDTDSASDSRLIDIASGDNTITVPKKATGCILTPPAGNTVVLKIKGAGGDTGIQISKVNPFVYMFDVDATASATTSFILNAAAALSAPCEFEFF